MCRTMHDFCPNRREHLGGRNPQLLRQRYNAWCCCEGLLVKLLQFAENHCRAYYRTIESDFQASTDERLSQRTSHWTMNTILMRIGNAMTKGTCLTWKRNENKLPSILNFANFTSAMRKRMTISLMIEKLRAPMMLMAVK